MIDLFNYHRRATTEVRVGALNMGGDNPVRVQSMTTTDTNDTKACVAQAERIIKAGGELVRLTTQGVREAENLQNIKAGIRAKGYDTPLVADVHFNPKVADVAARHVERCVSIPATMWTQPESSSKWNIRTRNTPMSCKKLKRA